MKIQRKTENTEVRDYIAEKEEDSITILKKIFDKEDTLLKNSKRATFFINLVYCIGLLVFSFMIYKGMLMTVLPAFTLITIEVFIMNLLIYSITKQSKKQRDDVNDFYMGYEYRRNLQEKKQ